MAYKKATIELDWKVNTVGLKAAEDKTLSFSNKAQQHFKAAEQTVASFNKSQAASSKFMADSDRNYTKAAESMGRYSSKAHLTQRELQQLKQEVADYNNKLESSRRQLDLISKSESSYTGLLKAQGHMHAANSDHLKAMQNSLVRLKEQYSAESDQLRRIATRSGTASKAFLEQKIRVNELGTKIAQTADKTSKLTRTISGLKGGASALNTVYDKTKALSLGVGAGFVYGAKKAIELQHEYKVTNNLISTGGESVRESMKATKQMQADGEKYSIRYGKSQKSIAEGYQELVKRGYTSQQALGSMKSMLKASVASGDDFSDVVHDSTAALESFGLRADSTAGMVKNTKMATNQMAYAADLTATDFHSMGTALEYVGSTAHQSKLSLSETSSAIGILSNNGLEADKAGTGLRKVLTSLQAPSKSARGALKDLGLSTKDFVKSNGDMKSMADIFGLIEKHTSKMGAAQKAALFHNLFGATGQASGAILADNAKQLGSLNKQVQKAGKNDYTGKLSAKNMKSAQNQLAVFKQEWEALSVTFARTVLPEITQVAQGATSLLSKFDKLSKNQKTVATWGVVTVAAIAPIAKGMSGVATIIGGALSLWKKLRTSMALPMPTTGVSGARTNAEAALSEAESAAGSGGGTGAVINSAESVGTRTARLASTTGKFGRLKGVLSKIPKAGKATVALTALAALPDLLSMTKKTVGKHVGSYVGDVGGGLAGAWAGGKAGALAGGAIGSVIPVVGTTVGAAIGGTGGAIIGGIGGSKIGSKYLGKAGDWIQKDGIKDAKKAWDKVNFTVDPSGKNTQSYGHHSVEGSKTTRSYETKPKTAKQEFDSLPKDAQKATKQATGYIKAANADWTKSEGLWHAGSAKSRTESNKMQAKSDANYDKAYASLEKYSSKTNTSTSKSASYLAKLGLINQNQASKAVTTEQAGNNKRLAQIKSTMAKLKQSEHTGGKDRFKLQQQLNGEILRLTSKGNKKQTALLTKLNGDTKRLSTKQYKSITKQSAEAANSTIKSANKSYRVTKSKEDAKLAATTSSANKQYNKTKAAAADIYGKNSKMYNQIMTKAGKTRDDTISKAQDQHDSTVKEARNQKDETITAAKDQHAAVVLEAQKQAGDLVDSFADLAGNAVSAFNNSASVEYMLNQNQAATGGKYTKKQFKPSDLTKGMAKSNATYAKITSGPGITPTLTTKGGIGKSTKSTKKTSNSLQLNAGYATGGAIQKRQTAMVGENGVEVLQRGKQFSLVGQRGAQLMGLKPGDQIYNNHDARRMMAGSYGQRIKGFASGTTSLGSYEGVAAGSSTTSKQMQKTVKKNYDKMAVSAKSSVKSLQKQNKKSWQAASDDTSDSSTKIRTTATKNSNSTKNNYVANIKSLDKQNGKIWTDMTSDSKSAGTSIAKNADAKSSDAKDFVVKNWKSLDKQFTSISDDMASRFNSAFKKLGPYASKAMGTAVTNLNKGVTAIDTTLAQFGGNKAVLKPIHYAEGSKGPIASDRMAVLNDAKTGPRQELVVRNNQLLKPQGKDVLTPLQKGDEVLNGSQVDRIKPMLPHFAKGTGVSDKKLVSLASKNSASPAKAWKSDFDNNVGNEGKTDLAKGITKTAKGAADSVGPKWSGAMWGLIDSKIQGGGDGSLAPHFGAGFKETSGYGQRTGGFHKGIDFGASMGTPIPAQYAGTVVTAGSADGFGNWVVIRPDGMNINTIYGHMKSYRVHSGQHVKAGQIIANVGAEGEASGPHVHYELRKGLGSGDSRPNPDTYKGVVKAAKKSGDKSLNSLVKSQLGSKAIKWISEELGAVYGELNNPTGGDVERWRPYVVKALKANKFAATGSQVSAWMKVIQRESNGNPNVVNTWDPNAKAGHPSKGLVQTIGPTFEANKFKGHGNIFNGFDDLLAGIHYAAASYGRGASMFARVSGPKGYAKGGRPQVGKWALVGENGPELFKTDEAGTVVPHAQTKELLKGNVPTPAPKPVQPKIDFHPTININVSGDGSSLNKEQVTKWIKDALQDSYADLKDLLGGE